MKAFLGAASYAPVILGSVGMIVYTRFPTVSAIWELKHCATRVLGLNGYYWWIISWLLILLGTAIQWVAFQMD